MKSANSVPSLIEQLDVEDRQTTSHRHYFRGHSNRAYQLVPKLARKSTREFLEDRYGHRGDIFSLEEAISQRFRRYAAHHHLAGEHTSCRGAAPTDLEWLCIGQHHGLPTLLLDWTLNPLVAAFWAVRSNPDAVGHIWHMKLRPRLDRVKETIYLTDAKHHDIQSKPNVPLLIVPWAFTSRIEAQAGRFTYSHHEDYETPLDRFQGKAPWIDKIEAIQIPSKSKETIARQLQLCCIQNGTMFPDLDGCAAFLAGGGL